MLQCDLSVTYTICSQPVPTGVGEMVKIAVERGRATRPNLELGICGEHGEQSMPAAWPHVCLPRLCPALPAAPVCPTICLLSHAWSRATGNASLPARPPCHL